jgi:hypothetical protein
MRRIADANELAAGIEEASDHEQHHEMYRKTLEALVDIDADDENEGVAVVTEWIIEQLEDGTRPSSEAVRRRARQFCEHSGYELPDDSWLGE